MAIVIENRWYQTECADSLFNAIKTKSNCNPIGAVPTGAGKSVILALVCERILEDDPKANILVLSHVKRILSQNYLKLVNHFDGWPIGLYSSGLKSRTISKITVGGIQSVYRNIDSFKKFTHIIIDECHLVNTENVGMYRRFLDEIGGVCIGLTATPYRTKGGYLTEGKDSLFTEISYDLTDMDSFNRLVDEGYLSKLVPIRMENVMDTTGIRTKAGDFHERDLSEKFDKIDINSSIVDEIIKYGKNKYKKWLIFCIDIEHCDHVAEILNKKGIKAASVHSKMVGETDDEALSKFESGEYRALVSVEKLTTGIDVPDIDLIAMMRPTKSPLIHVQCLGRGLRVAPWSGKTHCLVLDFAGNTSRIGPINDIKIKKPGKKGGGGQMTKDCPECPGINHLSAKFCECCGYEYPKKEKLVSKASNIEVMRTRETKLEEWVDVKNVFYSVHNKKGKPSSLRVVYDCGFNSFSEYVCIDHTGYAKVRAIAWIKNRWTGDKADEPKNLVDLLKNSDLLKKPKRIFVNLDEKYPKIVDFVF